MSSYVYVNILIVLEEKNYTHSRYEVRLGQLGCAQKSSTTATSDPSQLPHKYLTRFSTKRLTDGIQGKRATTGKMRLFVFRSGNAVTDPRCKMVQVRDSLRE